MILTGVIFFVANKEAGQQDHLASVSCADSGLISERTVRHNSTVEYTGISISAAVVPVPTIDWLGSTALPTTHTGGGGGGSINVQLYGSDQTAPEGAVLSWAHICYKN